MTDLDVLKTISYALTPVLLTIVAWFMRVASKKAELQSERIETKVSELDKLAYGIRKDIDNMVVSLHSFDGLRDEWYEVKTEVGQVLMEMKSIRASLDDVVIIKRDQQTMWRRIDELRLINRPKDIS